MNLQKLIESQNLQFFDVACRCGGGSKGPSAQETLQQTQASKALADAETARLKAEQDAQNAVQAQKVLADNVQLANADQARRQRNRTLLASLGSEEGLQNGLSTGLDSIEDPNSPGQKKAKRSTLIASYGA